MGPASFLYASAVVGPRGQDLSLLDNLPVGRNVEEVPSQCHPPGPEVRIAIDNITCRNGALESEGYKPAQVSSSDEIQFLRVTHVLEAPNACSM